MIPHRRLAAGLLALALVVGCSSDESANDRDPDDRSTTTTERDRKPSRTTSSSTTTSSEPTSTSSSLVPVDEGVGPDPISEDLAAGEALTQLTPESDHASIARAWAIEYHARPAGTTQESWVARLAPLATPELAAALNTLRFPPTSDNNVTVVAGTGEVSGDQRWTIRGHTIESLPDGPPAGPPQPFLVEITVEGSPALVSRITYLQSGFTLP